MHARRQIRESVAAYLTQAVGAVDGRVFSARAGAIDPRTECPCILVDSAKSLVVDSDEQSSSLHRVYVLAVDIVDVGPDVDVAGQVVPVSEAVDEISEAIERALSRRAVLVDEVLGWRPVDCWFHDDVGPVVKPGELGALAHLTLFFHFTVVQADGEPSGSL